ncbi:MAG: AAA family ATPase, partial [Acidimicrobiales bacterium]
MRPLRLQLAGLRSYRREVTVDFRDRSLVAIVGDTGAGKSSLLEAITYALYGASTWPGPPSDLISDHVPSMRVELDFRAGGDDWTVTRSMSRTAYPPAVHRLENRTTGQRFDGRSEVTAQVSSLVGLDLKAFLGTVVLPQGRFAELLTA